MFLGRRPFHYPVRARKYCQLWFLDAFNNLFFFYCRHLTLVSNSLFTHTNDVEQFSFESHGHIFLTFLLVLHNIFWSTKYWFYGFVLRKEFFIFNFHFLEADNNDIRVFLYLWKDSGALGFQNVSSCLGYIDIFSWETDSYASYINGGRKKFSA